MEITGLSKTAAIREARKYVSKISRRDSIFGASYVFRVPIGSDPTGVRRDVVSDGYFEAMSNRSRAIARIALDLMLPDEDEDDVDWMFEKAVEDGRVSIEGIIDYVIGDD